MRAKWLVLLCWSLTLSIPLCAAGDWENYRSHKREIFSVPTDMSSVQYVIQNAQIHARNWGMQTKENRMQEWLCLKDTYPLLCDWIVQDLPWQTTDTEKAVRFVLEGPSEADWETMVKKVYDEIGSEAPSATGEKWIEVYIKGCIRRRQQRLAELVEQAPVVVFTKHVNTGSYYNAGWTHYAFNEALSESTSWNYDWEPGSALCLMTAKADGSVLVETLLEDPYGIIRDPDVSFDGKRILFSWKKSLRGDDYHLYEMDVQTRAIRQLTNERGHADYEAAYLPDGNIIFNSTRCVQMVDCFGTPVSNIYRCDANGKHIRRLTYDQVHDNYPQVLNDGRIIYTRWEYSDRGQIYPQPLMVMRPDGSGQMAYYGMNSYFPTSLLHTRPIPGSTDVISIVSGHHTAQTGKLARVNINRGEEQADGIHYLAPEREATPIIQDGLGNFDGDLFSHPYPLDEETFIVSYCSEDAKSIYPQQKVYHPWRCLMDLYYMKADGRRELLARDRRTSCNQPVAVKARPRPAVIPSHIKPHSDTALYYLQDIYEGPGLEGIKRGDVQRLRVIEIEYRAAAFGCGRQFGKPGDSAICTPVAASNGTWDVKRVLGEIEIGPDGSAYFEVPAETPLYFQALDDNRYAIQTMRTWSTLQRGEKMSCVGCHETKRQVPTLNIAKYDSGDLPVQKLEPFYGQTEGFSFIKEIQPILDKHCISCHWDTSGIPEEIRGPEQPIADACKGLEKAFSLLGTLRRIPEAQQTKRLWSDGYLALAGGRALTVGPQQDGGTRHWGPQYPLYVNQNAAGSDLVNWVHAQSEPPMLKPYTAGAATSKLMEMLRNKHKGVELTQEELDKIACWIDLCVPYCGDYMESNDWTEQEVETYKYYMKRREELSNEETDLHVQKLMTETTKQLSFEN